MTNLEKAEKAIKEWVEYYEKILNNVKEKEPGLIKLAKLLDELGVEMYAQSYDNIEIKTENVGESRKLLSKILEKTNIPKFIKVSSPFGAGLRWSYAVEQEGIDLRIFPAEPNKDCVAVQKTNSFTTWVCEQRKES